MSEEGLGLVNHPNCWQALIIGSDGKSPLNTQVLRMNGSPLMLECWATIHSTVAH